MTSVFFIAIAAFSLVGSAAEERLGIPWSARLASICMGLGGLIGAIAPAFAVLLVGRAFAGLGTGIALIACPVIARALRERAAARRVRGRDHDRAALHRSSWAVSSPRQESTGA